jgi:hypothetical protein
MAKTEVYSWRLAPEKKAALEAEARAAGKTIAEVLDTLSAEWLAGRRSEDDEAEQRRLHAAVGKTIGTASIGNPRLSETVEQEMHRQLKRQHGR